MNDWDHEQRKDVESRHEQSITLPGIWQLLNKLRIPSILQTKEMVVREEKTAANSESREGKFHESCDHHLYSKRGIKSSAEIECRCSGGSNIHVYSRCGE